MNNGFELHVLQAADRLFGWLLYLPADVRLLLLAGITCLVVLSLRRVMTDQDRLARCYRDKQRLSAKIRENRRAGNKEEVARLQALKNRIGLIQLRQEWRPLAVAILPILAIAYWASSRLHYRPLKAHEPFNFRVHLSPAASGTLIHLVPVGTCLDGWIKEIPDGGVVHWTLRLGSGQHPLTIRYKENTFVHPVLIGMRRYAAPRLSHEPPVVASEVGLEVYRPFGVIGGFVGLPPWLIGYLMIVLILTPISKRLSHTY